MADVSSREVRPPSRTIGPLRGLMPFLRPYRLMVWGALAALTVTAMLSLSLPLAVRRVVDNFFDESLELVDAYFLAAVGIAALLALGTAARFYLVTRLGERVIADIRRAIYDRVIGMSPGFFERVMTGEVLSRLTTDTTLVLSVIGSSVSVALRNVLTLVGGLALLFWTSPKLTAMVLVGVPLVVAPILMLGRRLRSLSRESQDRIARSSAEASETLLAAQTVQSYTHEAVSRDRFGALTEQAFDAARRRIVTRSVMTAIVIFLVFTSIVAVLWIGRHPAQHVPHARHPVEGLELEEHLEQGVVTLQWLGARNRLCMMAARHESRGLAAGRVTCRPRPEALACRSPQG
jgi:ATP-binding cassette subfamily B protein